MITCICPVCNAVTNFHDRTRGGQQLGFFLVDKHHVFGSTEYAGVYYQLFSCAGCGRGGIAEIHYYHRDNVREGELRDFHPVGIEKAKIPKDVPKKILAELSEAERCASVGAWRAGSAMLRSVLEKVFEGNGYTKGVLKDKINESNKDGIITDSRAKKAHDDVRALGNDILHDEWKEVTNKDFVTAYHYCQRVIEDFYDERDIVSRILEEKGRVKTGNK